MLRYFNANEAYPLSEGSLPMLMARLMRVWPHDTIQRKEDFLSECFAELLQEDSDFLLEFLGIFLQLATLGELRDYTVTTQHSVRDSRFDVFVECQFSDEKLTLVIENKVDAGFNEYQVLDESGESEETITQIQKYQGYVDDFEGLAVVYLGRDPIAEDVASVWKRGARFYQVTWGQVAKLLGRNRTRDKQVTSYLRLSLLEFLEDNGMGDYRLTGTEIIGATKLWRFSEKVQKYLTVAKNSLPAKEPYNFVKYKKPQWWDDQGYMGYGMGLPTVEDCVLCLVVRYNHQTIEPDIPDLQFHIHAHPKSRFNKFLRSKYIVDLMENIQPYREAHHLHGGQELEAKWRVLNLRQSMKYVLASDDQEKTIVGFYVGLYAELERHGLWDKILELNQEAT